MKLWGMLTDNLPLRILALALACLLWFFVAGERNVETELQAPLEFRNIAPGLAIAGRPPRALEVRVAGPAVLMMKFRPDTVSVPLDLAKVPEGSVTFSGLEKSVRIPAGLRIVRIHPSAVEVKLAKKQVNRD